MKRVNLLILATVSLLVACEPAALPAASGVELPTVTPTEVKVSWNTAPEAIVVSATFHGGLVPQLVEVNYIPDARIWGNGRIIWVHRADGGGRHVLEGHLTPDEMATLLQRMEDDGFFDWEDMYAERNVLDAATKCLAVELESRSKRVCEYVKGAPDAFHELYKYIANGAGTTGKEYLPERGYLVAYPLGSTDQPVSEVHLNWTADSLGFSLSNAAEGMWVEGEALKLAWPVVNANPWSMVVRDGDTYYQISIQVPGVTLTDPTTR